MSDDFLRTQLRQAQDALTTAERLRAAAEDQYREAVARLGEIARSLLPAEWNGLRREHPEAASWPPQRLAAWVVETGRHKLNRLEMLTQGDLAEELEALTHERDELAAQLSRARDSLATLESGYKTVQDQVAARDAELARLREEIVELREREGEQHRPSPQPLVDPNLPQWLVDWKASSDFKRSRAALEAIGSRGFCLRLNVAQAIGLKDASSGWARKVFEALREHGIIEEERPKVESVGQTPYLLRLTKRGHEAYRMLFGEEPVESEYDRLLARHKSAEHVHLNLQARDVLMAAGASSVDLHPRPVDLPNGGTFDVDLVAVFDSKPLYVEAERGSNGKTRVQKWSNYAVMTKDFYVVVPNTTAQSDVISETSRWSYDHPGAAEGVTLHLCQLSAFDKQTLWQIVRPLGRRERRG